MLLIRRIVAALLTLVSFNNCVTIIDGARSVERHIQIINSSGHRVEIFWVHPQTSELIKQTDPHVHDGATFELNSFVGHTFQVIELPSSKTGACIDYECKTNYFTVSENDDQGKNVKYFCVASIFVNCVIIFMLTILVCHFSI